jgi:ribosome maturation factor RimP
MDCPVIGVGKKVEIHLTKAMRVYNGTLQASGELKAVDGKSVTTAVKAKAA